MLHTAFQHFIDGMHGAFFATILHWAGAIAFIAGLVLLALFLAQRRDLPAGDERRPVLPAFLILGGIVLNVVGGFMRLWQSDHPGLSDVAHSTWVQALAVKHGALILGMSASVVLLAAATPAAQRRLRALSRWAQGGRAEALAATALLGVAVATIVGALVTTIVTPGMAAPEQAGAFAELAPGDLSWQRTDALNFTGALTGTPVQPGMAQHAVAVPDGALSATFALSWEGTASELRLEVTDPAGEPAQPEVGAATGRVQATVAAPGPGTWTVSVVADRAVDQGYRLETLVVATVRAARHEQVVEAAPGSPAEFEMELPPGGRLRYDYYLVSGEGMTFQVHQDDAEGDGVQAETAEPTATGSFTSAAGGHYGVLLTATQEARGAVRLVGEFTILALPGSAPPEDMDEEHAHG